MIAPIKRPPRRSARSYRGLATARRAVAAALLGAPTTCPPAAPRASRLLAWLFVAWTMAVAVSYFAAGPWWIIGRY